MKIELHLHTAENDLCAHVPAAEAMRMYKAAGYDAVVVTDHYFSLFFDDWFAGELAGKTQAQRTERWLRGYRAAKEEGDRIGLTVLPGAEVRFDGASVNDYLLYGVDEAFFFRAPPLCRLSGPAALRELLPADAVMVQAHPFRDNMTVRPPSDTDGIEIYNGGTEPYRNEMARAFAAHYGIGIRTSGSDFHAPAHLGRGGILTETEIHTPQALARTLRQGTFTCIETR